MGHKAVTWALRRENLKVRDRLVLLHLAHEQIEEWGAGEQPRLTEELLAERAGYTKRTVRRALRSLDSEGHLGALQEFRL